MTYIVPHFRYGALVFLPKNIGDKNNKSQGNAYTKFTQYFNQTIKKIYDLPITTPKITIEKIMGN